MAESPWRFQDRHLTPAQIAELDANVVEWEAKREALRVKIVYSKYEAHLGRELQESTYHDCKHSLCSEWNELREL